MLIFLLVIQEVRIQIVGDNTCSYVTVIQEMDKKINQDHRSALGCMLIVIIFQQKYYRLKGMHYKWP
jgi:hypothetical protein